MVLLIKVPYYHGAPHIKRSVRIKALPALSPATDHSVVYLSWRKTLGRTSRLRTLCVGPSQGAPWSERCGLPTTTYITEGNRHDSALQHAYTHQHARTAAAWDWHTLLPWQYCTDTLKHLQVVRIVIDYFLKYLNGSFSISIYLMCQLCVCSS